MKLHLLLLLTSLLIGTSCLAQGENLVQTYKGRKAHYKSQKILDLSFQNLTEIPLSANNPEIEVLILDYNKIQKIPSWIANLKNLRILSLNNNNLSEVNPVLGFCTNLELLFLSGNYKLNELPDLSTCEKLEFIDVIDTQIDEVPDWVELLDSIFYFKYSK